MTIPLYRVQLDFRTITNTYNLDDKQDIIRAIKELNRKANSVLCKFSSLDPFVMLPDKIVATASHSMVPPSGLSPHHHSEVSKLH